MIILKAFIEANKNFFGRWELDFKNGFKNKYVGRSKIVKLMQFSHIPTLREKCPYSEFFWSVISRIWTEYGEIPSIRPNAGKCGPKKLRIRTLFTQCNFLKFRCFHIRDDEHMTSMKIVQFSKCLTPLVHLRPKFFYRLDLRRPISNKPTQKNLKRTPHYLLFRGSILLCMQLSKNITKCFLFIITHSFRTHFAINLFCLHNLKT